MQDQTQETLKIKYSLLYFMRNLAVRLILPIGLLKFFHCAEYYGTVQFKVNSSVVIHKFSIKNPLTLVMCFLHG